MFILLLSFFFFHPFLYPQKVALAQFPELSSSERDLGIFRNQQPVSCSAKSSAEIQPFTTDRHSGETHRHHQTRLELVRKHILIHTNSYTDTHFLNNPQDFNSRHVTLLKNECDCVHIDVVDTFSDSWGRLWHLCSYVWGKKSNFWQKCFLMAQSVE